MPEHAGKSSPRPSDRATSARLIVTFLALVMLLLLLAPVAIGWGAYILLTHYELFQGTQRILVSVSVGLFSMLIFNIAAMLPLAQFAAHNMKRLQSELTPEEQQLVTQLAAQHQAAPASSQAAPVTATTHTDEAQQADPPEAPPTDTSPPNIARGEDGTRSTPAD